MYLVGTMSITEGLHQSTREAAAQFDSGNLLYFEGNSLSLSRMDIDILTELGESVLVSGRLISVRSNEFESYLLEIDDKKDLLGLPDPGDQDLVIAGNTLQLIPSQALNLTNPANEINLTLTVDTRTYFSDIIPNDWLIANEEAIFFLEPDLEDQVSFVLISMDDPEARAYLDQRGYNSLPLSGVVEFFDLGFQGVIESLWWIILLSAVVVFLLIYNVMGIEIMYRTPDIRVIKYLGGTSGTVFRVFTTQTLFISSVGVVLGSCMGIIASNGLVSILPLLGKRAFLTPAVDMVVLGLPALVITVAGFVGGLIPSWEAARQTKRALREEL